MSLAVYLDPSARECHPLAGAGPSASAPRTTGPTSRRYVVVPHAERTHGEQRRRRLGCPDRSPSPFSSTALGTLPPLARPIALVDSRTSRGGILVPPSAPGTGARPFGQCGQPPWAPREP